MLRLSLISALRTCAFSNLEFDDILNCWTVKFKYEYVQELSFLEVANIYETEIAELLEGWGFKATENEFGNYECYDENNDKILVYPTMRFLALI